MWSHRLLRRSFDHSQFQRTTANWLKVSDSVLDRQHSVYNLQNLHLAYKNIVAKQMHCMDIIYHTNCSCTTSMCLCTHKYIFLQSYYCAQTYNRAPAYAGYAVSFQKFIRAARVVIKPAHTYTHTKTCWTSIFSNTTGRCLHTK